MRPGTPEDIQPPARPAQFGYANQAPEPVRMRDALPGALMAGAVAGLGWILPPIGYLLWPITAGVLGVTLYRRRLPDSTVSSGAGARIGAVTGLFGFVIFIVLTAINIAVMGQDKFRELLNQAFQQAAARNPDPQALAMMQRLMTPAGISLMFVLFAVIFLVLIVGFSSLGGMLGARLMKKR